MPSVARRAWGFASDVRHEWAKDRVGGLAAESVVLCSIGGAMGVALSVVVAGYLESILSDFPGLPVAVRFFVVSADSLVTAFALLLVSGTVAGLIPALNATRLEVASILHKDAP